MTTIRPADELGSVLAGRGQATKLRARVEQLAQSEGSLIVDFDGVIAASPSFADEFFAKLDPTLLEQELVAFVNVPSSIAAIARYVRNGRAGSLPV